MQTENEGTAGIGKQDRSEVKTMGDLYEEVALFCFRFLGFKYLDEVDRLTIPEFMMHLKAHEYILLDQEYHKHSLAYLVQAAKSTTGSGKNVKPKFPTFKRFFDYEKALKKLDRKEQQSPFQNWREYKKRKAAGHVD